jgi:hypothetical protein
MQELMAEASVTDALGGYERYLDNDKVEKALR